MKSAGLLGGHHTGAQSSMLASTCIWPVLNAGRPAVALHEHTPEAEAIRSSLDELRREVGAHILGVPPRAPAEGILGELGWPTDMDMANAQHLRLFGNFMRAPHSSLPLGFMQRLLQLNTSTPHLSPPFVQHAMQLISAYGLSVRDAALPCWKDQVRRASDLAASARWRHHVMSMPSLAATYPDTGGLGMAAYLRMGTFRGRQLLAQARLNVLPLESLSGEGATRTCRLCHDPAPDPRSHLLLTCSSLASVRDAHAYAVPELNRACPLPSHARISYLLNSPRDKARLCQRNCARPASRPLPSGRVPHQSGPARHSPHPLHAATYVVRRHHCIRCLQPLKSRPPHGYPSGPCQHSTYAART